MPPTTGDFRVNPRITAILSGHFDVSGVGFTPPSTFPTPLVADGAILLASPPDVDEYYLNNNESADADLSPKAWRGESKPSGTGFDFWTPYIGIYELDYLMKRTIVFDPTGTNEAIDLLSGDFPLGCRFSELTVFIHGHFHGRSQFRRISNLQVKGRGIALVDNTYSGTTYTLPNAFVTPDHAIIANGSFWGAEQVVGTTAGSRITIVDYNDAFTFRSLFATCDLVQLRGVYDFSWMNLGQSADRANPGDEITLTDGNNNFEEFEEFEMMYEEDGELIVVDIPAEYILTHNDGTIVFIIPPGLNIPFDEPIAFLGSGPLYTGIVLAQFNADPILVNGSGIYTLVPGKRNDTYYDRSGTPTTTIDLPIRSPFGRTGFVR